jgi:cell division protein ZapA
LSDPSERVVPVFIQGQRYPIRSTLDPAYIAELAAYVDEKMRAAAESGTAHDTLRLAVLAALNIADEMFRCRESAGERARAVVDRTRAIEQMLDAALHS